jgi:hypothetical protein
VEVAGGLGVARVVGPSPWRSADVGVNEVGVGAVADEEVEHGVMFRSDVLAEPAMLAAEPREKFGVLSECFP